MNDLNLTRLDWDKLNFINAHYIREADAGRLARLIAEVHARRGVILLSEARARLDAAADMLRDRGKTLVELADQTLFLIGARPLDLDAKTLDLVSNAETRSRIERLRTALAAHDNWTAADLEVSRVFGFSHICPSLSVGSPPGCLGRLGYNHSGGR